MSNQGSRQKLCSVEVSALASKFSRLLYKGEQGSDVSLEDMARLSPLGHVNINMLGRYCFELPKAVQLGAMRPLRLSHELNEPFT